MQQGGLVLHNHSSLAPGKDYSSCKGTCSIPRSRKSRQDADRLSRLRKGCLVNLPLRAPLRALLCASLYASPTYTSLRTLGWGGAACHAVPSAAAFLAAAAAALAAIVAARFSWTDGSTRAIT